MINFLHRYTGALSKCLLSLICLSLLAGQLINQPCCPHGADAATSTAMNLSRQPARDPGNTPDEHCHRRVYLLVDKRYDLKPALFLPAPLFRLAGIPASTVVEADCFSSMSIAGVVCPAFLRGPPAC